MATPEALVKYYDCLKDSFDKIQDKDNETALVNAALRPKIREEFTKSEKVLESYLNYIKIFSLVFPTNQFKAVCITVLAPLFKENNIDLTKIQDESAEEQKAIKIHQCIESILKSRHELTEDFVNSVIKIFPTISKEITEDEVFLTYLKNCLKICTYEFIHEEPLLMLVRKIMEKCNPSLILEDETEREILTKNLDISYELIYQFFDTIEDSSKKKSLLKAILKTFTNEFLASPTHDHLKYLLLYICSLDEEYPNEFIGMLNEVFLNSTKSIEERRASSIFVSSFISRASYVSFNLLLEYLEFANSWCCQYLTNIESKKADKNEPENENVILFYSLIEAIFYIITQRYREMYDEATLAQLEKLDLNKLIGCHLKPLEVCDSELRQRFQEVALLYRIVEDIPQYSMPLKKRRRSDVELKNQVRWKVPYKEKNNSLPERIKHLYRNYFDHRNFTIYRE